ncbi:MAG: LSM domain-containing protein [Candidatus Heimdallarchaeota archaeon]
MSRPMELLDRSLNKIILIRLKGQRELRGVLKSFDSHLNLILETAEDIAANGRKSDLGTILVRGDNVVFISPPGGDTKASGD